MFITDTKLMLASSCCNWIDEGRATAAADCSDSCQHFDRSRFDIRLLTVNSLRFVRVRTKDKGKVS